ncbi:MAG: hypothetical protein V3S07_07995 [Micropepsaceae bacterium]
MQTSIFLAKLIGPVFVLMGIAVILDSKRFQQLAREFIESEALIFLSGIITLPIGLAIVNTHNVWVFDWPVVITFFGWLAIAAGIARMTMPNPLKKIAAAMIDSKSYFFASSVVTILLGAYLSYQGYIA